MKKPKSALFVLLAVAAVIVIAVIYFMGESSADSGRNGIKYKEFAIERGLFEIKVSASGVVKPIDRVEIKSKASGLIEQLPVEEGDFVEKGALVARLDQTDVRAELDEAQANLEIADAELTQAQNTYNRRKQLFDKGMISEEDLDNVTLQVAQARGKMVSAKTSLSQAEERFAETIVRAPISGVILQKYVEEGQIIASGISNVSGGTAIADIANMQSVYIEAGIDEIDVGRVKVDQEALVIADAYPEQKFTGHIIRIAPEARVDQNVTLFDVVIEVENIAGLLKSGMNATVEITIAREENVFLAPVMALRADEGSNIDKDRREVLVKEDGQFVPRVIKIGRSDFDYAVVLSGLKEGDIIGVPMTSRLKAENERMEERIKSSRSFGTSGSSDSSGNKKSN